LGDNSKQGDRVAPSPSNSRSTANAAIVGITTGPDNTIWFTEYTALKAGMVTP
jgi:hypothetical protein